jgi:hypothetical protein
LFGCFKKKKSAPWLEGLSRQEGAHGNIHLGFLAAKTAAVNEARQRRNSCLVRNFKSMQCIANMFDLRTLTKFSMVCRSFYWIAGRKQVLVKFYKKE